MFCIIQRFGALYGHLCIVKGVLYASATQPAVLHCINRCKKVKLTVSVLRSKAQLIQAPQSRNLPGGITVPLLCKQLPNGQDRTFKERHVLWH